MTQPRVRALAARTTSGYRRAWARERLRDSFVLGIIASATLTFLGVVFTLTLVALQLASSQLSPRVVRMFVRSGVTKLAFGILLAAFSYSVAFLVLGVLQGVDHRRLVRLAQRHDCVFQLLVRVGEYIPTGGGVIAVHALHHGAPHHGPPHHGMPPDRAILSGLNLGRTRTVYQDPSFGLRQLVDIAIQALSPAVNQPTTAVQVIDRLEDLVLRIGRHADRTGCYADEAGQVRFVEPVLAWADILDLAFNEITAFGAGSVQVSRRLLAAYDALEAAVPPARRPGVAARRAALLQESADQGVSQAGLVPDALGLG